MIHVTSLYGLHKAMINKQDKLASGFIKETPWLLLHNTGRTDRFGTQKEAKEEARKCYPACKFNKADVTQ